MANIIETLTITTQILFFIIITKKACLPTRNSIETFTIYTIIIAEIIVKLKALNTHLLIFETKTPPIFVEGVFGGSNEDRTRYLIVANDALSQMSYGPVFWLAVNIISLFL